MEEKITQKHYIWSWTLYKAMVYLMGVYGIVRLIITLIENIFAPEIFTFDIIWSVYVMCAGFIVSSILGIRVIKKKNTSSKLVLIISIISAIFTLFTTFKLIGMINSSEWIDGSFAVSIIWIFVGLIPAFLLLGSILTMSNVNSEVDFEADGMDIKEDTQKEIEPENDKAEIETEIVHTEAETEAVQTECTRSGKDKGKIKYNMTTGKVFGKTLGFVAGRLLFSLGGLVAGVIVLIIGIFFTTTVWQLETGVAYAIDILFAIIGFIAYFALSKIGKTTFRNAQIAAVSYTFYNDKYLEKDVKTSDLLNNRFQVVTLFPMIIRTIDLLIIKFFKRKDKEFVHRMNGEWIKSFWDFLACFLTGVVPILGFTSLSWFLQHPEGGVLKGACDGLYGIYKSGSRLAKRMIFVFLMELLIIVVLWVVILLVLYYSAMSNEIIVSLMEIAGAFLGVDEGQLMTLCGVVAVLIIKFVFWLFIQSYGMISVLNVYTKATKENPPGTSPLYTKLMGKYNSFKQKRAEKTEEIISPEH